MKKIISFVGLFAVLGVGIGDAHGVAMSAQVRRLLQEKQEKIEQLEKCEGKKQGWMIAGISTIGLTAVGVGVNIAQASKSNRLSDEIEMEKSALEKEQNNLNRIQNDIAAERTRQAKKAEEEQVQKGGNNLPVNVPEGGGKYDSYELTCGTVSFTFAEGDEYTSVLNRLNAECNRATNHNMFTLGPVDGRVLYECMGYKESITCTSNGGIVLNGGVIGQPCAESVEDIANSNFTGVWTHDDKGQYTCHATANDNLPIPCACKKMEGGNGVVNPEKIGKKGEQTECKEGQVRIGGKGDCVKRDYLFTDSCKCAKDSSKTCKLDTDHGGDLVCQLAKGIGKKCKCEDCPSGFNLVGDKCMPKGNYISTGDPCDKKHLGQGVISGYYAKDDSGNLECFSKLLGPVKCLCRPETCFVNGGYEMVNGQCKKTSRKMEITGRCLNEEGDTAVTGGDFCWCDIYIPDYCSKSKLFDKTSTYCARITSNSACSGFCNSKQAELVKLCDESQGK